MEVKQKIKMIPRVLSVLLSLFLTSFFFCGCFQARQLNERLLVQAVGIDWVDGQYLLTLQAFAPAAEGGGSLTASSQNAKLLQSHGETIAQALQNATQIQGKEIFLGHSRILVIGEALAKRGVDFPLTYFASSASARHNLSVAVAVSKAADILSCKINQGILPGETLEKILENSKENGMLENILLFEFLASLENKHDSAILPVLKLAKSKGEESSKAGKDEKQQGEEQAKEDKLEAISEVSAVGMAIFSDSRMVGILEGGMSQGLMWLRDSLKQTTLTVQSEDYSTASVHVYKSKSSLIPNYSGKNGDKISFSLEVECEATIGETQLRKNKTASLEATQRVQSKCEELIEKECNNAFSYAVTQKKSDIFNLGNIVWKDNAKLFKTMRDEWPKELPEIELSVKPKVTINRFGLTFENE